MLNDFNNYSFLVNYDSQKGFYLFRNRSVVRNQSNRTFTSERYFAHYLLLKGIICYPINNIFLGQIIRKNNIIS